MKSKDSKEEEKPGDRKSSDQRAQRTDPGVSPTNVPPTSRLRYSQGYWEHEQPRPREGIRTTSTHQSQNDGHRQRSSSRVLSKTEQSTSTKEMALKQTVDNRSQAVQYDLAAMEDRRISPSPPDGSSERPTNNILEPQPRQPQTTQSPQVPAPSGTSHTPSFPAESSGIDSGQPDSHGQSWRHLYEVWRTKSKGLDSEGLLSRDSLDTPRTESIQQHSEESSSSQSTETQTAGSRQLRRPTFKPWRTKSTQLDSVEQIRREVPETLRDASTQLDSDKQIRREIPGTWRDASTEFDYDSSKSRRSSTTRQSTSIQTDLKSREPQRPLPSQQHKGAQVGFDMMDYDESTSTNYARQPDIEQSVPGQITEIIQPPENSFSRNEQSEYMPFPARLNLENELGEDDAQEAATKGISMSQKASVTSPATREPHGRKVSKMILSKIMDLKKSRLDALEDGNNPPRSSVYSIWKRGGTKANLRETKSQDVQEDWWLQDQQNQNSFDEGDGDDPRRPSFESHKYEQDKAISHLRCWGVVPIRAATLATCAGSLAADLVLTYLGGGYFDDSTPLRSTGIGFFLLAVGVADSLLCAAGLAGTCLRKGSLLCLFVYTRSLVVLVWVMVLCLCLLENTSLGETLVYAVLAVAFLVCISSTFKAAFAYLRHVYGADEDVIALKIKGDADDDGGSARNYGIQDGDRGSVWAKASAVSIPVARVGRDRMTSSSSD